MAIHQLDPEDYFKFKPSARVVGDLFDILITNEGNFSIFKSEKFALRRQQKAIKLSFRIPNLDLTFEDKWFLVKIPKVKSGTLQETSGKKKTPLYKLSHSKSCAPFTIAVNGSNFVYYEIGDDFWIPFWGFNDSGVIKNKLHQNHFAFFYVCNLHHFKDFETAVKQKRIKYRTEFPFHDDPVEDTTQKCYIHKDIGFPI